MGSYNRDVTDGVTATWGALPFDALNKIKEFSGNGGGWTASGAHAHTADSPTPHPTPSCLKHVAISPPV